MVTVIDPKDNSTIYETDQGLKSENGDVRYPLINGAYRIVSDDNYATNFGLEWNRFQKTQIDKYSGNDISEKRFFNQTRWTGDLKGENILEAGSGAGRFSQIILEHTEATLYSIDFSNAVEANYRNNGPNNKLHLFQASIYELPFAKNSFDKVVCLGVLQHTPDFKKSVQSLINMVKPGGELVVDFYPIRGWYTKICAKYLLRPFTKKMNNERLMKLIEKNVDWMTRWYKRLDKAHLGFLNRFIPICDINRTLPAELTPEDLRQWIILDTFDMFSPEYDSPQTLNTVASWFKEMGMIDVDAKFINYTANFEAATVKARKHA